MYRIILFLGFILFYSCEKDPYHDGLYHSYKGKFVYVDREENKYVIVTFAADVSRQITNTDRDRFSPQWFPDGKHIMYLSNDQGKLYIHVMDDRGHNDHSLIQVNKSSISTIFYPVIHLSPDGKFVVQDRADSVIIYSVNEEFNFNRIASFNCTTDYKSLIWAPDSKKFSCACPGADSVRHLNVYDLGTGQINDYTKFLGHDVHDQSWSYNSSLIAFISSYDIYLINANGTGLHKIVTTSNFLEARLSFSPFDNRIIYERADSLSDLVMYDVDTRNTNILIEDKKSIEGPLLWVEDGKYVFYAYGQETFKTQEFRLFDIEVRKNHTITYDRLKGVNYINEE